MKKDRILYFLGFLFISTAYFLTSIWLQSRGFFNLESYFLDYKVQVLQRLDSSFLRTFYFTRPGLLFLFTLPFSLVFKIHGTFFLNAILIGMLTNHLLFKSLRADRNQKIFIVYLIFSPVMLYAGVSGGSLALYLLFYFIFFNLLLKYNSSQSVYHLTLLSLLLGAHVLMDAYFVKLVLLVIPVFFFVGFYKAKGISGNFFYRAAVIFRNNSQRRKFFTGFFSSIIVVCFIPGMSYLIYLIINKVFAGEYLFFQNSIGDSWSSYTKLFPLINPSVELWQGISFSSATFLALILLLSSLAIFKLFDYADQKGTKIAVALALLFVLAEASTDKIFNLNLNQLSLLIGAGLAAIYTRSNSQIDKGKKLSWLPLLIPFLAVGLEWTYFHKTIVANERLFVQILEDPGKSSRLASLDVVAKVFDELPPGRVLADDAIFYPEISMLPPEFTWQGHFSSEYLYALQKPEDYADYLIVTKESHPLHLNDIVYTAIKRSDFFDGNLNLQMEYEDNQTMIFSLNGGLNASIR